MHYFYVYLIKPEKRLLISQQEIESADYELLMNCSGTESQTMHVCCKMFCGGYIQGNSANEKVINEPIEFANFDI